MAQVIKSEQESHLKPKIISSKKQIEDKKTIFARNSMYSNLTWEDIAGLI